MIAEPTNPIMAVTHPNPYPYYHDQLINNPFYYDQQLKIWIASSAQTVAEVLTSDLCRVRPSSEPIPRALLDSPAADIFQHLIRMNDGQRHCPVKRAVKDSINSLTIAKINEHSHKWAQILFKEALATNQLADFAFQLPVYVIASLLNVPPHMLQQTVVWVGDFVRCLSPISTDQQLAQGKIAASQLLTLFQDLVNTQPPHIAQDLLSTFSRQAQITDHHNKQVIIANAIGFLSQAYEATAGLIGNTLVALTKHDDLRELVISTPDLLPLVIEEVLRYDPPIQNTRRFVAQNGLIASQAVHAGDSILVVLAAANRDPQLNLQPDTFDIHRTNRQLFTFGAGSHLCPGTSLAIHIAQAGITQLIQSSINLKTLLLPVTYRPSINARIALIKTK